ncbi:PIH1 domain-containing protein 1-like [Clavelina lepadiformis]|uniref:PIH1 domain-containing protein 1-like n=1 Tax=Clavelina lepadiformis TaxID=159417 RepID=UPI0040426532
MEQGDTDRTSELFNVGSKLEGMSDEEIQELYQNLLTSNDSNTPPASEHNWSKIKPTPGCCIKTKNTKTNEKVFINICTSSSVPTPDSITEEKLLKMLDNLENPNQMVDYKVPMSVGPPHAEIDNKGNGCTAYDVIISPNYLHTINNSKIFFGFFMSIVFEALLNKHEVDLERKWILLKTKKFLGSLDNQAVRKQTLIQELPSSTSPLVSEVASAKKPKFEIVKEPENDPDFLIAEIKLPEIKSAKSVIVDVGKDRLVVCTRPKLYELDIFLPYSLVQEECGSQFNIQSHILTITMPVLKH